MGADMHAAVDQQEYLDDPLGFMSEYGAPPSIDVTVLRDSDEVPETVKDMLYWDLDPSQAGELAAKLCLLRLEGLPQTEGLATLYLEAWLMRWACEHDSDISGIH